MCVSLRVYVCVSACVCVCVCVCVCKCRSLVCPHQPLFHVHSEKASNSHMFTQDSPELLEGKTQGSSAER